VRGHVNGISPEAGGVERRLHVRRGRHDAAGAICDRVGRSLRLRVRTFEHHPGLRGVGRRLARRQRGAEPEADHDESEQELRVMAKDPLHRFVQFHLSLPSGTDPGCSVSFHRRRSRVNRQRILDELNG